MAGLDDRVTITLELQSGNFASQLQEIANKLGGVGDAGRRAGQDAATGMGGVGSALDGLIVKVAGVVAAFEAMKFVTEGIGKADSLRDLHASMTALERDAGAGEAAWVKFEAAAAKTRDTADDLARAFRDAIPAAMRRGISDETLASITVQISKIAPLIGQSLEGAMQQWEQIMSGRVRKTNMLANLLLGGSGYTIEDLVSGRATQQVFGAMFSNMDALATKGEAMGQTFASVGAKIKDALLDAFAAGFEGGEKGYQGLLDAFTNPALLSAVRDIGEMIKAWLPTLQLLAKVVSSPVTVPSAIGEAIGERGFGVLMRGGGSAPSDSGLTARAQALAAFSRANVGMGTSFAELEADADKFFTSIDKGSVKVGGVTDNIKALADAAATALLEAQKKVDEFGLAVDKAFRLPIADAFVSKMRDVTDSLNEYAKKGEQLALELEAKGFSQEADDVRIKITEAAIAAGKLKEALTDQAIIQAFAAQAQVFAKFRAEMEGATRELVIGFQQMPTGLGGPLAAQASALAQIYAAALDSPDVRNAMDTSIEEASKQIVEGFKTAGKVLEDSGKRVAEELERAGEQFAHQVVDPLSSAFADLATTGGKNFGQIMGQAFLGTVHAGAGDLVNAIFGIGKTTGPSGEQLYTYGGQTYKTQQQAQGAFAQKNPQVAGLVGGGVAAFGAGVTGYTSEVSDLQNAVSAIVSAASVYATLASLGPYGWVAAAAVAVAQVIGKLLQPSPGAGYQYVQGISVGPAGVMGTPNKNVDADTWMQMQAAIKQQYDLFYDGFYKILLKFPMDILPKIENVFRPVYGRFEEGANLGMAASEKFGAELKSYIETGLPHQIADSFSKYIQSAFVSVGFAADRFGEIWKQLSELDPKTALQNLSDLADAVLAFNKDLGFLSKPAGLDLGGSMMEQVLKEANQSFADSTEEMRKKMSLLGQELLALPDIEGQVGAAKELAGLLDQYVQKTKDFLRAVADSMQQIAKSYRAQMEGYALEGMKTAGGAPDYAAQARYLQQQAALAFQRMGQERDPAKIQQDYQEIAAYIDKIKQIGGNIPGQAEAYLKWAQQNLTTAYEEAQRREQALAQQAEDTNKDFLKAIRDFITAFETATQAVGGGRPGDKVGGGSDKNTGPKEEALGKQVFIDTSTSAADKVANSVKTGSGDVVAAINNQTSALVSALGNVEAAAAAGANVTVMVPSAPAADTFRQRAIGARRG